MIKILITPHVERRVALKHCLITVENCQSGAVGFHDGIQMSHNRQSFYLRLMHREFDVFGHDLYVSPL